MDGTVQRATALLMAAGICLVAGAAAAAESVAPLPAAATGGPSARVLLGEHDLAAALRRVREQALSADRDAEFLLGMMLQNGVGTAADEPQAQVWLERAAQAGQSSAAFMMAWLTSRDPAAPPGASTQWLQRAATLGDARALEAQRDPGALLHAVWRMDDGAARNALALHAARHDDVAQLQRLGDASTAATDEFGQTALALAVDAGAGNAADWLLSRHADPGRADLQGITPLMRAAARADAGMLKRLLAAHATVNAADREKRTALMVAARLDRNDNLDLLRAAGANLNATDSRDYNALDIALLANATHVTTALRNLCLKPRVAHGVAAKPGLFDGAHPGELYRDWPPVALAVARNDAATLKQLLDGGATVNQSVPTGDTLVHVAYHAVAGDALTLLLSRGADAMAADRRGRSVLGLAAGDPGRIDTLGLLLNNHVSPDAHAGGEAPPLIQAIRAGNAAAITQLLAAGANADVRDRDSQPALQAAVLSDDAALLPLFLQHGANVNTRDGHGRTALWLASSLGREERVRTLLTGGAQVDTADLQGITPLTAAAAAGHLAVVDQLLRSRASAGQSDHNGDTALHAAAAAGHTAIVQSLLLASAPADAANQRGDTPLIAASRGGHMEVCRLLQAAGTKATLRNKNRQTAADVARSRGFTALADLLDRKS